MTLWEAIILGVVEGLTEYLPISSTGHLILAQRSLQLTGEEANAYAICIQAGAIVAVLGLYWNRVKQMTRGLAGRVGLGAGDRAGWRLATNIAIAFLPAAVVGLLLDEWIEAHLFGLWPIVFAWILGGVAILVVDRMKRRTATPKDDLLAEGEPASGNPDDAQPGRDDASSRRGRGRDHAAAPVDSLDGMTWRMALLIGLIQCVAMWPGTSRSLVTIVGGVLVGLSLAAAVEFSFLLGVLTLLAATAYKSLDAGPLMLEAYGWTPMLVGTLAAWISAVAAVKWMVGYLKKHGLAIFGYYRVALGVVVGGLVLLDVVG